MVDDDTGYLMRKEDIPLGFWHAVPNENERLTHLFPNSTFLAARCVRFDKDAQTIVSTFKRILTRTDLPMPTQIPVKSRMTAQDICTAAGPCPPQLMFKRAENLIRVGIDEDDPHADDDVNVIEEDGEEEENDGDGPPERARNNRFRDAWVEDRHRLEGGLDANQDATVFAPLMDACRCQ
jgi:hypothetical protein